MKRLRDLRNIGATIEKRLNEIGIRTPEQLADVGAVEAWRRIRAKNPNVTVPVCYYLYSIEGALRDVHWDDLPTEVKKRLVKEAKG
ncbi:MAG: TfoX/Sxy family protein [Bryobacterales bacterium]|nr:TfoX/Sxy family protein [Bryobacterales bacterium]